LESRSAYRWSGKAHPDFARWRLKPAIVISLKPLARTAANVRRPMKLLAAKASRRRLWSRDEFSSRPHDRVRFGYPIVSVRPKFAAGIGLALAR